MINDELKMKGDLIITVFDSNGELKDKRELKNLVVTSGKSFIASRMAGISDNVMGWIAVGTDNTSPVVGNTSLGTEISRVATDVSGGTPSSNTVLYTATFAAGIGTGSLTEAGIFNASSSGTMLARTTFATVNKGASDTVTISWTITIG